MQQRFSKPVRRSKCCVEPGRLNRRWKVFQIALHCCSLAIRLASSASPWLMQMFLPTFKSVVISQDEGLCSVKWLLGNLVIIQSFLQRCVEKARGDTVKDDSLKIMFLWSLEKYIFTDKTGLFSWDLNIFFVLRRKVCLIIIESWLLPQSIQWLFSDLNITLIWTYNYVIILRKWSVKLWNLF